jgi:arylsulfatase A-like enzyme
MRNILLVVADCLREDVCLEDGVTTQNVDRLRELGVACTPTIASASSTVPCFASLLTGQFPFETGVTGLRKQLLQSVDTLPEHLQAEGYTTAAFVTGPLSSETGLDRGFDTYEHRPTERSIYTEWGDEVAETLDELPEPWFAMVHLWELHAPITHRPGVDAPAYDYHTALEHLDERLASLLDRADEDTLVAVHGDHGENVASGDLEFRIKKLWDRLCSPGRAAPVRARLATALSELRSRPNRPKDGLLAPYGHGYHVYEYLTRVPFIVGPTDEELRTSQLRQIDVLPTLFDLAGVGTDLSEGCRGTTAREETNRPGYAINEPVEVVTADNQVESLRYDKRKIVRDYRPPNRVRERYDLSEHPEERKTVAEDTTRDLDERLTILREDDVEGESGANEELLRDLGYL